MKKSTQKISVCFSMFFSKKTHYLWFRIILVLLLCLPVTKGYGNHKPRFTHGHSYSVTAYGAIFSIDPLLAIIDTDVSQWEHWSFITVPAHGYIMNYDEYEPSTGGIVSPLSLGYLLTIGYTGSDSFTMRVTDGIDYDTITIHVTISPPTCTPIISTLVGVPGLLDSISLFTPSYPYIMGVGGYGGDGGPSTAAHCERPTGLITDDIGNVYMAQEGII